MRSLKGLKKEKAKPDKGPVRGDERYIIFSLLALRPRDGVVKGTGKGCWSLVLVWRGCKVRGNK